MTRLSHVDSARLRPEQQVLFDAIASGPRAAKRRSLVDEDGHLTGVFNAFLHAPAMGAKWSELGEVLRFKSTLDRRLFELSVLVVAAYWHSGHEWAAHVELARKEGLSDAVIAAVQRGDRPSFENSDEAAVHGFVSELVSRRRVSAAAYGAAAALLGEAGLVELGGVVAYYIALAAMMNAFDVHPPKEFVDPWPGEADHDMQRGQTQTL